jgi:hypothetical protein
MAQHRARGVFPLGEPQCLWSLETWHVVHGDTNCGMQIYIGMLEQEVGTLRLKLGAHLQ